MLFRRILPCQRWAFNLWEFDLDHVDELDFLAHHVLDAGLESGQLYRRAPGQALLFPGSEPRGDSRSKFGGRHLVGVARLGDVEPPRLPPLYGLHEGSLEPCDIGHLAHHGASALRLTGNGSNNHRAVT